MRHAVSSLRMASLALLLVSDATATAGTTTATEEEVMLVGQLTIWLNHGILPLGPDAGADQIVATLRPIELVMLANSVLTEHMAVNTFSNEWTANVDGTSSHDLSRRTGGVLDHDLWIRFGSKSPEHAAMRLTFAKPPLARRVRAYFEIDSDGKLYVDYARAYGKGEHPPSWRRRTSGIVNASRPDRAQRETNGNEAWVSETEYRTPGPPRKHFRSVTARTPETTAKYQAHRLLKYVK